MSLYLKRWAGWIGSGLSGWAALAVFLICLAVPFCVRSIVPAESLNGWIVGIGLIYQVSGFGITIYSLANIHKELGGQTIWHRLNHYLKCAPFRFRRSVRITPAEEGGYGGVMPVGVRTGKADAETFEELKQLFLQEKENTRAEFDSLRLEIEGLRTKYLESVKEAKEHSRDAESRISDRLERTFARNIAMDFLGVGLFTIGIVLATIPSFFVNL
ncbi:hypothetical protein [Jannaschia pohangensis]|uniref:hypothetical protein n=1 Tax=Jannaschia pohangensis TaxID=390807 RepID=UPI0011135225|nr:hypothetical protein [Jannaschia pohangensis]